MVCTLKGKNALRSAIFVFSELSPSEKKGKNKIRTVAPLESVPIRLNIRLSFGRRLSFLRSKHEVKLEHLSKKKKKKKKK